MVGNILFIFLIFLIGVVLGDVFLLVVMFVIVGLFDFWFVYELCI